MSASRTTVRSSCSFTSGRSITITGDRGPEDRPYGNGVLPWFEIDDFDAAVARASELRAEIVLAPHRNPPDGRGGPNHREIWIKDPNGYIVVLASPDGKARPPP